VTSEQALRAPASSSVLERSAIRWWSLVAVIVVVSGLAVWVTSPRLDLEMPSLVDDWAAISRSPDQLSELARLANPEEQRFRPGWIVWNYLEWHTFDAPEGLVGPNAWNIVRLLIFVTGLCLLTALALPSARGRWDAALFPVLAGLPVFLVLAIPKFARDLAWFGTQEPLLIGGMALGGSLVLLAARSILADARAFVRSRTAALAVAGSGFWLLGVYQKESSVCALPLIAAALYAGRARLAGWARLSSGRRIALAALGGVVLLPLIHVGIEILLITARGNLVYDAEVDSGRGILRGAEILYDWAHEVLSPDAQLVVYGAVAFAALAVLIRRRVDVLTVGALASGVLAFLFASQSGVAVSRYFIPVYALFAVALALSLARLPRVVQLSALAWMILAFVPLPGVRAEVSGWADEEQQKEGLVRAVVDVQSSGCVVATAGLDAETRRALPVLVEVERRPVEPPCRDGSTYFVLGAGVDAASLVGTCVPDGLQHVVQGAETMSLYRCTRLRADPIRDPLLGVVEPETVVALRRLHPTLGTD